MVKKILVADDTEAIVDVLCRILEEEGFKVISAFNGKEAYEKFKKYLPEVLVLDLNMPLMNGLKVCEEIKKNNNWNNIKVVIISSDPPPENDDLKEKHGISFWIRKPFDYKNFIDTIKSLIN